MVAGVSGACYKKFRNLEEARAGWYSGPNSFNGDWIVPQPRPAMQTVNESTAIHRPHQPQAVSFADVEVEDEDEDEDCQPQTVSDPDPVYVRVPPDFQQPDIDAEDGPEVFVPPSPATAPLFSPALTAGTLSPRTVATPQLPLGSLLLSDATPSSAPASRLPAAAVPSRAPAAAGTRSRIVVEDDGIQPVLVSKPKEVFVVVRGARPGIYFDR